MGLGALEALREIRAELARDVDDVPDGWLTDVDWADQAGLARSTVSSLLLAGVRKSIVERQRFRINTGQGVRSVWHYRQISKPAKKK
jgi:hypothetical protein